MQPELTIIALSLWMIVFLGLTCVVYAVVSMCRENRFGRPLRGIILVHLGDRRFLCCDCPSRRIRSENQIIGESHAPRGSCDGGLNMQITQVNIRIANEDLVKGYVDIVFDNCFMIEEIGIIKGPTGLFISFPAKKQRDGTYWGYCFSSQRRNTADDRANHTGGVRERSLPEAIY